MNFRRQSGLTLIGFIIVLAVALFFIYAGMRVIPMYIEYHALVTSMNSLEEDPTAKSLSPQQIKRKLEDFLWVNYSTENIQREHMRITRAQGGIKVRVAYEVRKPFLGNIDIVGHFDRSIILK